MLRSNSTRSGECAESVLTRRAWISSDEACRLFPAQSVSCEADWLMAVVLASTQPSRADRPTKLPPSTNTSRLYDLPVSLSVCREFLQQQQQLCMPIHGVLRRSSYAITAFLHIL